MYNGKTFSVASLCQSCHPSMPHLDPSLPYVMGKGSGPGNGPTMTGTTTKTSTLNVTGQWGDNKGGVALEGEI